MATLACDPVQKCSEDSNAQTKQQDTKNLNSLLIPVAPSIQPSSPHDQQSAELVGM